MTDGSVRATAPPTRELAAQLELARGTVATAYEPLVAEGFLVARVGAGTYVADDVPQVGSRGRRRTERCDLAGAGPRPPRRLDRRGRPYDFGVGVPDPALFPSTRGGAWWPPSSGPVPTLLAAMPIRPVCSD